MQQSIANIALIVKDYDEAIHFYTQKLKFDLIEDSPRGDKKRWVLISPRGTDGTRLLLARAEGPQQESRIGDQTGGRVFLFLHTDDFWRDYQEMKSQGIQFHEQPREESYGTVVVFSDLYGNKWDLLQPKE
ncbi:MAG: VOC family protein [Chloroflexi bacterium]|nr:VOC family protein [Chloroflexota bacterium]